MAAPPTFMARAQALFEHLTIEERAALHKVKAQIEALPMVEQAAMWNQVADLCVRALVPHGAQ